MNEYPHPMQHACPDCKGKGTYQGIGPVEDCKTCDGAGSFIGVQLDLPNDIYPKGTKKEDWDQVAEAFKICEEADNVTLIKGKGAPDIQVGEVIYVYDAGWYEAEVVEIYDGVTSVGYGLTFVRADHTCGTFRIPRQDICWNITEDRWEYIRCGTPVW